MHGLLSVDNFLKPPSHGANIMVFREIVKFGCRDQFYYCSVNDQACDAVCGRKAQAGVRRGSGGRPVSQEPLRPCTLRFSKSTLPKRTHFPVLSSRVSLSVRSFPSHQFPLQTTGSSTSSHMRGDHGYYPSTPGSAGVLQARV